MSTQGQCERLLSAREVGEWVGVTPKTVSTWARDADLPGIAMPHGRWRFRSADVEAWLESRARVESARR